MDELDLGEAVVKKPVKMAIRSRRWSNDDSNLRTRESAETRRG